MRALLLLAVMLQWPENRVWAFAPATQLASAQTEHATPSSAWEIPPLAAEFASGFSVAGGIATSRVTAEALDALANGDRVGSALKADPFHMAPSWADPADVAANGKQFSITGNYGATTTLVQSPGGVNDAAGRFEWIIQNDGTISHQLFVPNGTINGIPIRP